MPLLKCKVINHSCSIEVADLAVYNAGHLHAWLDATDELDAIQAQINAMIKQSPVEDAEEYAIHDYDGFEGCSLVSARASTPSLI
jgi:antirestriction protein